MSAARQLWVTTHFKLLWSLATSKQGAMKLELRALPGELVSLQAENSSSQWHCHVTCLPPVLLVMRNCWFPYLCIISPFLSNVWVWGVPCLLSHCRVPAAFLLQYFYVIHSRFPTHHVCCSVICRGKLGLILFFFCRDIHSTFRFLYTYHTLHKMAHFHILEGFPVGFFQSNLENKWWYMFLLSTVLATQPQSFSNDSVICINGICVH